MNGSKVIADIIWETIKFIVLTVGKTYMVIKQDTFGRWICSDAGYVIYVKNIYFN